MIFQMEVAKIDLLTILSAFYIFFSVLFLNFTKTRNYIKQIKDIKSMIKKYKKEIEELEEPVDKEYCNKNVKSLRKKITTLEKERIEPLEGDIKKSKCLSTTATIISIVVGAILISSYILPAFADIQITNGKDIELLDEDEGVWKIKISRGWFSRTFNLKNEKIILRVEFQSGIEIKENNIYYNPTPDEIKIDKNNQKEYVWDILQDVITVQFIVTSESKLEEKTWVSVEVRTSAGLKYSYKN